MPVKSAIKKIAKPRKPRKPRVPKPLTELDKSFAYRRNDATDQRFFVRSSEGMYETSLVVRDKDGIAREPYYTARGAENRARRLLGEGNHNHVTVHEALKGGKGFWPRQTFERKPNGKIVKLHKEPGYEAIQSLPYGKTFNARRNRAITTREIGGTWAAHVSAYVQSTGRVGLGAAHEKIYFTPHMAKKVARKIRQKGVHSPRIYEIDLNTGKGKR